MALQLGALRDALLDAGASEAKAALAAEELAGYEDRFDGIERRLDQVERKIDVLRSEMSERFTGFEAEMNTRFAGFAAEMNTRFASVNERFAEMAGRMTRLDWMLGTLIVLVLGVLGRLLFIH